VIFVQMLSVVEQVQKLSRRGGIATIAVEAIDDAHLLRDMRLSVGNVPRNLRQFAIQIVTTFGIHRLSSSRLAHLEFSNYGNARELANYPKGVTSSVR
jgi:hypothetical protein